MLFGIAGLVAVFIAGSYLLARIMARRNPERYGPRPAAPGQTRQTRRQGLALAALESIPIIHFRAKSQGQSPGEKAAVPADLERGGAVLGDGDASGMGVPGGKVNHVGEGDEREADAACQRSLGTQQTGEEEKEEEEEPEKGPELDAGHECAICLAVFVEKEEVRLLPCKHTLHSACIDPWLLNVSSTCPIW